MKKYIFLTLMLSASIITIFSCRKSFEPQPNQDQVVNSSNDTEMKIQEFLNRMQSNLKDETTYSIEDAIWYAEATINYTYAIYDSSFITLSRDTSTYSIDLNQDYTVNESALLEVYDNMVDSLVEHYGDIPSLTKHVVLCDVINEGVSSRILHLSMISVIGVGYIMNQSGTFGPTDYWYAGALLGKCGEYSGYEGRDATTELEYKLVHLLVYPAQNMRVYYTDIDSVQQVNPYYYEYTNSPRGFRGYYFYTENPYAGIQCLPPSELNFYISSNGIPYIIEDNDTFIDKEFCLINVIYEYMAGDRFWLETHLLTISYGIKHNTSQDPQPLE